jgi:predicted acetyltransferase
VDLSIRRAAADDFAEILVIDGASFGVHYSDEEVADIMTLVDPRRFLVATDAGRIIGNTGDYPFTMTVPGGSLNVPGVSWVSVDPTYRRRGVLRELMHRQLRDFVAEGAPAAILTASEGGIYGRFGYGIATQNSKTVIDRRRAVLARPGDAGGVERVSGQQARDRLPGIHRRWQANVPGALSRSEPWWDFLMLDRESERSGMSALFHLVHADGYISYRVKTDWADGDPRHLCWIADYAIVTAQAHAALWQVLLGMDLFGSIETFRMPLDDPLPYLLTDPRRARPVTLLDGLWLRPLDVAAVLGTRSYGVEVETVLEVRDDLFGDGRFLLRGGPEGSTCERTDRLADVVLGVGALGSASLGGVRLETLARAGLAAADDHGKLARLDRAMLADRLPSHGTAF